MKRQEAQKKQLLGYLAQTAINLNQTKFTINLDEARNQLKQSFIQIKAAFDELVKENLVNICQKHRIDNNTLYTCELKIRS